MSQVKTSQYFWAAAQRSRRLGHIRPAEVTAFMWLVVIWGRETEKDQRRKKSVNDEVSWVTNARGRDNRRVTGLQRAGARRRAVTILEKVVRSFLEKLTLEQRFEGVRQLHVDILKTLQSEGVVGA